jgi:hypothetical protein
MICSRSSHCIPPYKAMSSPSLLSPLVSSSWVVFLQESAGH